MEHECAGLLPSAVEGERIVGSGKQKASEQGGILLALTPAPHACQCSRARYLGSLWEAFSVPGDDVQYVSSKQQ